MLLYVHRHNCSVTSTQATRTIRDGREPRTATSTFTQLLSSDENRNKETEMASRPQGTKIQPLKIWPHIYIAGWMVIRMTTDEAVKSTLVETT